MKTLKLENRTIITTEKTLSSFDEFKKERAHNYKGIPAIAKEGFMMRDFKKLNGIAI